MVLISFRKDKICSLLGFFLVILMTVVLCFSCKTKDQCVPEGYSLVREVILLEDQNNSKMPEEDGDLYYFFRTLTDGNLDAKESDLQPFVLSQEELHSKRFIGNPLVKILPCMKRGVWRIFELDSEKMLVLDAGGAEEKLYLHVILDSIGNKSDFESYKENWRLAEAKAIDAYKEKGEKALSLMIETLNESKGRFSLTSETGINYQIVEDSTGGLVPRMNEDMVEVSYILTLSDGKMIDQTFAKGRPLKFIPGGGFVASFLTNTVLLLSEGQAAVFKIPSQMVYDGKGFKGNIEIPAGIDLHMYMKLERIYPDFKRKLY